MALAERVHEVGQCQREGCLGEPGIAQPWHQRHERAPADQADQAAAEEGFEEHQARLAERRLLAGHQEIEQHREDRDRGRIVEQALALDQAGQARGRAEVAEDRDHRGRIGGRDDRREQQAGDQRHARERPEREPDRSRGREHGDHREHEDRRRVLHQAPDVDRERGLEQKDRQEDEQEPARGDREVEDQGRDVIERRGQRAVQKGAGADADDHAEHGEQHGVRQVEPGGERLQQPDQDQETGDREQDVRQADQTSFIPSSVARRKASRGRAARDIKSVVTHRQEGDWAMHRPGDHRMDQLRPAARRRPDRRLQPGFVA